MDRQNQFPDQLERDYLQACPNPVTGIFHQVSDGVDHIPIIISSSNNITLPMMMVLRPEGLNAPRDTLTAYRKLSSYRPSSIETR